VSTAKSGKAPVYIHVDENPLAIEDARTFQQDSTTAASAQWRSKDVDAAQSILLFVSGIQCFLGLITSYAVVGIVPLVSSILGLVTSLRYLSGNVSSMEKSLNWVRFPALMLPITKGRPLILFLDSYSRFASCSKRCAERSLRRLHIHLQSSKHESHHTARCILLWSA
jgi:hypothetical protein